MGQVSRFDNGAAYKECVRSLALRITMKTILTATMLSGNKEDPPAYIASGVAHKNIWNLHVTTSIISPLHE